MLREIRGDGGWFPPERTDKPNSSFLLSIKGTPSPPPPALGPAGDSTHFPDRTKKAIAELMHRTQQQRAAAADDDDDDSDEEETESSESSSDASEPSAQQGARPSVWFT